MLDERMRPWGLEVVVYCWAKMVKIRDFCSDLELKKLRAHVFSTLVVKVEDVPVFLHQFDFWILPQIPKGSNMYCIYIYICIFFFPRSSIPHFKYRFILIQNGEDFSLPMLGGRNDTCHHVTMSLSRAHHLIFSGVRWRGGETRLLEGYPPEN